MKANEERLEKFLSLSETVFAIPVYQRNYDWTNVQCKQLLNDILEIGKTESTIAHFLGSIVYIHDSVHKSSGITELTIIDGQQRLTTITLIYIVLYRLAKELKNEIQFNRIHKTFLINEFAADEEKLKLKPTENNKAALKFILNYKNGNEFIGYSKIIENFNYFKSEINVENYEIIQKGLSKLTFIYISLERGFDNPQRIFESLNSTGLELSQGDLIRNYILMGLNPKDQNKIYQNYWEIIEKNTTLIKKKIPEAKISSFIRDFLTLKNAEIPKENEVYLKFKSIFPTTSLNQLETILQDIKSLSVFYNKLLNPDYETDKDIRLHIENINKLEKTVVYPFLMKVYEDYGNKIINKATFIQVLKLIESYVWRRFVLELQPNALNKVFMNLYNYVDAKNYLESIEKHLINLTRVSRFPTNSEIEAMLYVKDFYNVKKENTMYFLSKLENFENKEIVDIEDNSNITIEHIFPQNPDIKWKNDLKQDEYNFFKEKALHTIANLSLTGNNGELGNKCFLDKRDRKEQGYKASRLWLNKYLGECDTWNKDFYNKRFEIIFQRFIKIWQIPDNNGNIKKESNNQEKTIITKDDYKKHIKDLEIKLEKIDNNSEEYKKIISAIKGLKVMLKFQNI